MAVLLTKHEKKPLCPTLRKIFVTLSWVTRDESVDLDASCLLLDADDKMRGPRDLVFYKNLTSVCGSVRHQGDNQNENAGASSETFEVDLDSLPSDVVKLLFVVTIHLANERGHKFGLVSEAFINVVDQEKKTHATFDLARDAGESKAVICGELYQKNGEWRFRALGEGFNSGDPNCKYELQALVERYRRR